jgi:hypothetical protein
MRFDDRAERLPAKQIVDTFVAVGPLLDVMANRSHQVIYGRRGVGKTHALRYFESQANSKGDLAIYIDCANLGSNNSTYNDASLSITERATRLLIDLCITIHWGFMDAFSDHKRNLNLAEAGPLLNDFIEAISEIQIDGNTTEERATKTVNTTKSGVELGLNVKATPDASFKANYSDSIDNTIEGKQKKEGKEYHIVNFQYLAERTKKLALHIAPKRVWLLIDEWSTIPHDLQPYLADLLRRSFFSVPTISVKIAAIEQRSLFKIERSVGGYIGIELGADAAVALNLDDYLVYDANQERSVQAFRSLIGKHVISICREDGVELTDQVYTNWTTYAFTQENVFIELVKASEGVPRDAMHILSNAAQRTPTAAISAPTLRYAALQFFQTEKYNAISANPVNRRMLDWIRYKVIDQRVTRAFLLQVGTADPIVDALFDLRALHILHRSMSAAHRPGERYVVYKLDYGCYVDLTSTDKFPSGMLFPGDPSMKVDFEVPDDDGRSYRRAILDLSEFYAKHPQSPQSR